MWRKVNFNIEEITEKHWEEVSKIYLEGINTGKATFQTEVPTWQDWNNSHIKSCRLIVCSSTKVLGWAALSPISSRCVYAGVAEVSIYIKKEYREKGIGTALLTNLIKFSEENGFWTLQSVIIKENIKSIDLHKKCGFRKVGIRERLGKMSNGVWHDVVLMEHRSKSVGMN